MTFAVFAAIGVLALIIGVALVSRRGRRTDVFADVMAFELARRALGRDNETHQRPQVIIEHDERRTA
jgi:hypothetical protein